VEQLRAAVRGLSEELAMVSERLENYELARQRGFVDDGRQLIDREFTYADYARLVTQAVAATSGDEVAQVMVTMALAAADDRADLRARVVALEVHNAALVEQNCEMVRLLKSTAGSVAALFGMVDDRLVDPADSVPADVVEVRVGVNSVH
jgi:hypothetical protein